MATSKECAFEYRAFSPEAVKVLQALITGKDSDAPVFERYARPRGMDRVSAMMMKRFRKVITDKKLSMYSDKQNEGQTKNTGCPEAVSMAILDTAPIQSLQTTVQAMLSGHAGAYGKTCLLIEHLAFCFTYF